MHTYWHTHIYTIIRMDIHKRCIYVICVVKTKFLWMRVPRCCEKWAEDYPNFKKAENIWPNIFKLSFNTTWETKLQSFQYRIIHWIITCCKMLSDINLINSPKCLYCNEIDNIRHFVLFCPKVYNLWNIFFQWWNRMGDLEIASDSDFLEESIIFGFHLRRDIFELLNLCILIAKYYIHNKRLLDDNNIEFLHFLYVLKFKLNIEHQICKMNNTTQTFNKFVFL